jgi:catechol 2,3-dioxygenase-like lactoylglutathione lyase family enzyme
MKYVCPLIVVENIARSKEFYGQLLGQEIKNDYGENVVFEGDFSIHRKEHYVSLLNGRAITSGGNNFELYFEHDDLEAIQAELKAASVKFIHEIQTQPWQQKALRIYDPDMNIIEIGESMMHVCKRLRKEGKSIEEIKDMTSLSIPFISKALNNEQE